MAATDCGIVVGYDGSPAAAEALSWAAREASARRTPLTVFLASDLAPAGEQSVQSLAAIARKRGDYALARGLRYAESAADPSRVRVELTREPPAQALCERSETAQMVVLGSHGHGRLPGLLLGSVPWKVAAYGHGKVIVVRGKWKYVNAAPGPVVAGVDGSLASEDAVAFAFEEAALRGVPLVAVCALADSPGVLGEARRLGEEFSQVMTWLENEHPDIEVVRQVVAGAPRSALLDAAQGAQLVVVGSLGRTGMPEMLLGSVAQALLHHSSCPVGIVHPQPIPAVGAHTLGVARQLVSVAG
jgi:nucleotide-binding universal stress UspA family protein